MTLFSFRSGQGKGGGGGGQKIPMEIQIRTISIKFKKYIYYIMHKKYFQNFSSFC